MNQSVDPSQLSCPVPLQDYPRIILGHGGGGKLSAELVEEVFIKQFGQPNAAGLGDSTVLELTGKRIAVSTDSFVVQPLFFPGGSIGDLAVNGTVNDLAMSGATPIYLTAGFILEEGFPVVDLVRIAEDMGKASQRAGVTIIAGDTKVVEKGHGDGCYINTSGIGMVEAGINIGVDRACVGDRVIVSGTIGDHGMAVMSQREGLEFESAIVSDSAPLANLVQKMLSVSPNIHVLRDPTRGGLATSLNEIAAASGCGIVLDQASIPVDPIVNSACEFLGLDPMLVANEGKLVAIVAAADAERVLAAMRNQPEGKQAAIIGEVVEDRHRLVVAKTAVGTHRIVTMPIGEQLPRIC